MTDLANGRYVKIEEAKILQDVGTWTKNPNYGEGGHPDRYIDKYFRAKYLIHWRPDKVIGEKEYALVQEV